MIISNSRQIPKTSIICSNKKYYDILYSYLQCISEPNEYGVKGYERVISKRKINFTKLGQLLNISRQTASIKFKDLFELGLLIEDEDNYYLTILSQDSAFLVPKETLDVLNDTLNEKSISTYVYLFNRYIANENKAFIFTLEQIKTFVGISFKTRSNDSVVTNILLVLKKLGLIDYRLTTQLDTSSFSNVKTIYEILWVKNQI